MFVLIKAVVIILTTTLIVTRHPAAIAGMRA
jgi:hypothetical protein